MGKEPIDAVSGSMPNTARKPVRARGELSMFPGKININYLRMVDKNCASHEEVTLYPPNGVAASFCFNID